MKTSWIHPKSVFIFTLLTLFLWVGHTHGQSRKKIIKQKLYDQDYGEVIRIYGVPDWVIIYPEEVKEGEQLLFDFVYLKGRHKPPLDTIQANDVQIDRFKSTITEKFKYNIWSVPYELSRDLNAGIRFIIRTDETVVRYERFPDYFNVSSILPHYERYRPEDNGDQFRTR